jgi:hypothetical protein
MGHIRLAVRSSTAAGIFCLLAMSSQAQSPAWTNTNRQADWGDSDYGCSPGNTPEPRFCDSTHVGHVAVCWPNRRTGECGGATSWCTYKTIDASAPPNGASPGTVWVCGAGPSSGDAIVVPHEFSAGEPGGFFPKTLKEMSSQEFQAILTVACAYYGVDCSNAAAAIRAGAAYATPYIFQSDLHTTAFIDRHPGEAYYAKFAAPPGYTTCKALIDVGNGSITGGSTFNGSIQRMPGPLGDGIGLYAVVPQHRPTGQWVNFHVDIEFVRNGTLDQHACWPNNTVVWQCTGQNCSTYPGARK